MGDWFGDWVATWFGAVDTGGGGGGGGTGGGAGGGPGTYPLPPGLTSQQKKAYAALVACAPCCESGSGSGSGGGIVCQNGACASLSVPASLVLSVNAIQLSVLLGDPPYSDNLPRFLGDFTLTYLENEVIQRDVDEECLDVNVALGTGWFSEWIDATDFSPPQYWRYYYDGCTGELQLHYKALDAIGCYLDEYYVRLPEPPVTTLAVIDCTNYLATAAAAIFTGSVAA